MEDEDIYITPYTDISDTIQWPTGGFTISLGPYETHTPPEQPDLFRHYITSQWVHSSHLADEDPQWQCESWIKSKPYLAEAWHQGHLEIIENSGDGMDYYYVGNDHDYCAWRLRWSEYFE